MGGVEGDAVDKVATAWNVSVVAIVGCSVVNIEAISSVRVWSFSILSIKKYFILGEFFGKSYQINHRNSHRWHYYFHRSARQLTLVRQVSFRQIGRIFQQNFEIAANHSLKCDIFVCFIYLCGRITCTKPVIESGRKFVKSMICVALPPDSASVKLLIDDNVPLNPMLPSIA